MKCFANARLFLLTSIAFTSYCADTTTNNSLLTIDPAFLARLPMLERATGFTEDRSNQTPTDWRPNLQLLVGVKAVEGAKRTIYFVQLTTLRPPPTNSLGEPWQPILRTNDAAWSSSNKMQFVNTLYPVRARVFNETGRLLKEGQTPMAWGMLTNGLMDLCRVSLETFHSQTNSRSKAENMAEPRAGKSHAGLPPRHKEEELMRAMGGGFRWMFGMFSDLQTMPAVANIWSEAQCAIRRPSAWTIVTSLFTHFTLSLRPGVEEVTLVSGRTDSPTGPLYRLPVDLNCDKRKLSRVEIIIGPAHGAEMLLAGIRSIHAVHPTKPRNEFFAQVLAAGTGRQEE